MLSIFKGYTFIFIKNISIIIKYIFIFKISLLETLLL